MHPADRTALQTDVEESPIDLISLTVAQRYSVLVTARNDTSANWAIHANMDTDMFDTVPDTLNPSTSRPSRALSTTHPRAAAQMLRRRSPTLPLRR